MMVYLACCTSTRCCHHGKGGQSAAKKRALIWALRVSLFLAMKTALTWQSNLFVGWPKKIEFCRIERPQPVNDSHIYPLRFSASIAMAEVSRQFGLKSPWRPSAQEEVFYEAALRASSEKRVRFTLLKNCKTIKIGL